MKKTLSITLSICLLLASLSATACTDKATNTVVDENVLRVASWDEYIDMGGDFLDEKDDADYIAWYKNTFGINLLDTKPLYEEFAEEYSTTENKKITVEYIPLQDNETMYGKIKMGDEYDLL